MTKYYSDKNKFIRDNDTPIAVGGNWHGEPRPSYSCPYCSRTLHRLNNHNQNEVEAYYCSFCNIESNLNDTELRRKHKLETAEGPPETPLASTKFHEPTVGRSPPPVRGTFAELQRRGMKIKNYKDEVKG